MASVDARRRRRCARVNPKSGTACPASTVSGSMFCEQHLCPQCLGEKSGHDGLCNRCHHERRVHREPPATAPVRNKECYYRRRTVAQRDAPDLDRVEAELEKLERVKTAIESSAEQREREYQELRLRLLEEEGLIAKELRDLEYATEEGARELELLHHRREILLEEADELEQVRTEEEQAEQEEIRRLSEWVTDVRGEYESVAQVVRVQLHRKTSRVKAERQRFEVEQRAFEEELARECRERDARDAARERKLSELEKRQHLLQAEWDEVELRKHQLATVDDPGPFRSSNTNVRRTRAVVPRHQLLDSPDNQSDVDTRPASRFRDARRV